ncbi:MAG TPA: hypothetical protein V6C97_20920 [Oculatellaceae cyanobacterium]
MSIFFRNAHNIEHYNEDLSRNHDHQVNHLANEVAHNLRFADFGCHTAKRLDFAATELNFDAKHLSKRDFDQEVAEIAQKLPNRDFEVHRNKQGHVDHISFDGKSIYGK